MCRRESVSDDFVWHLTDRPAPRQLFYRVRYLHGDCGTGSIRYFYIALEVKSKSSVNVMSSVKQLPLNAGGSFKTGYDSANMRLDAGFYTNHKKLQTRDQDVISCLLTADGK